MAIQGILVDVDYCTGCEACVLACQQEHGYSEKEFGIKITKLGPLHIDEANKVFQYDFIPQFTQWCDLCEERCGKGKKPTCVQHCQAQCLDWGPIEELAAKVDSPKQMIVAINEAEIIQRFLRRGKAAFTPIACPSGGKTRGGRRRT